MCWLPGSLSGSSVLAFNAQRLAFNVRAFGRSAFTVKRRVSLCILQAEQTETVERLEFLLGALVMRLIAIPYDGVQERDQDSHSELDQKKRFDPEAGAVSEQSNNEGDRKGKSQEQQDVMEDSA
jgi:hypothetical protein